MSMQAVALVRIQASVLASNLKAAGPSGTALEGKNGDTVRITALTDATLIHTDLSVRDADPEDLGEHLRELLGDALDAHEDERGIFTFPKAAMPKTKTYDEAIAEVAEMGEWAPMVSEEDLEENDDEEGDFGAVAADLLGGLGPDVMGLQQRMMAGDPNAMQEAMKHVGAILSDPTKSAALMKAVSAFTGEGGSLADMAKNMPGGMPNPADMMKNMDMGALQQQAEKMMADNPNLEKELRDQLGAKGGGEGDEG